MIVKSKIFLDNPVKSGQKSRAIAEIYVDKVTELPAYNFDENFDLVQGSIAYIIQSGELYIIGSDGIWYSANGEAIANEPT